jgi:putative photosynthetic complex assembly protein 2
MSEYTLPVLFTLFLWWFSTGVILALDGLPRSTHRWSVLGSIVLALVGLFLLGRSKGDASVGAAYLAFTSALLVWGAIEMSFLAGFVTGPRRHACHDGCSGPRHFRHAFEAVLHHELAIAGCACAVAAMTWKGSNLIGLHTFLILWAMRTSAKLNLFFGVRNMGIEFLPAHLAYLQSFFSRRRMNLFFPFSVSIALAIDAYLIQIAMAPGASPGETAGSTLLVTLLSLAVLEHLFMVVPLPAVAALWKWSLRGRRAAVPAVRS